jgi:hypothetical protein
MKDLMKKKNRSSEEKCYNDLLFVSTENEMRKIHEKDFAIAATVLFFDLCSLHNFLSHSKDEFITKFKI